MYDFDTNFFRDVAHGNLTEFSYLQPRMTYQSLEKPPTWQHPIDSVLQGEKLIKSIYEALRSGPKWNETLFLITYDEHGGFYDHVTPPSVGVPQPDSMTAPNGFKFDQLGVRVPTIAISPWIKKGTIVHDALPGEKPSRYSEFEATSVLSTSNILLGLQEAKPLGNRMAWSNTFAGVLNLD